MIESKILLDSVNEIGDRITTYLVTYPRIILAEVNTHRMLSRNSASSRAVPVTKILKAILEDPFLPVFWGKNQAGMQAAAELDQESIDKCKKIWLEGRDSAIKTAQQLMDCGLHKQIANRVLEPWMYVTTLITATEWENFFSLRAHKDAQPEFSALATLMLECYNKSEPKVLNYSEWHIPYGDADLPEDISLENRIKVSVARAARTSYFNFDKETTLEDDIKLHDNLMNSGHFSPFEHAAMALDSHTRVGNFTGWRQYRKTLNNENRSDSRVLKKRG